MSNPNIEAFLELLDGVNPSDIEHEISVLDEEIDGLRQEILDLKFKQNTLRSFLPGKSQETPKVVPRGGDRAASHTVPSQTVVKAKTDENPLAPESWEPVLFRRKGQTFKDIYFFLKTKKVTDLDSVSKVLSVKRDNVCHYMHDLNKLGVLQSTARRGVYEYNPEWPKRFKEVLQARLESRGL